MTACLNSMAIAGSRSSGGSQEHRDVAATTALANVFRKIGGAPGGFSAGRPLASASQPISRVL